MKLQQLRERLSELEQQISQTQQHGLELKSQIDRHESRIHFNEERLREFESQNAKALGGNHASRGTPSRRGTGTRGRHASNWPHRNAALEEHRQNSRTRNATRCQRSKANCPRSRKRLRKAQSDLFAAAQQLTRVRNEINALDLQKQGNVVRLEKLSAEKIQLEEERTRLEARLQEFAANVEAEKLSVQTQRGTVEERQQRLREIQDELTQITQRARRRFAPAGRETFAPERAGTVATNRTKVSAPALWPH